MLLESFQPEDFAGGGAGGERDKAAGVARLWELATGKKQPENVRGFAATYLKAHHPELGPRTPEAKALGITPRLDHGAYAIETVRPLFDDDRIDVRRLAVPRHPLTSLDALRATEDLVALELGAAGLRVERQLFTWDGREFHNVVGTLDGSDPSRPLGGGGGALRLDARYAGR